MNLTDDHQMIFEWIFYRENIFSLQITTKINNKENCCSQFTCFSIEFQRKKSHGTREDIEDLEILLFVEGSKRIISPLEEITDEYDGAIILFNEFKSTDESRLQHHNESVGLINSI